MDNCPMCVVHLFYTRVHVWFDATCVFAFAYAAHMCVPFKLWVICTVSVFQNIKAMEGCRSKIENGKAK